MSPWNVGLSQHCLTTVCVVIGWQPFGVQLKRTLLRRSCYGCYRQFSAGLYRCGAAGGAVFIFDEVCAGDCDCHVRLLAPCGDCAVGYWGDCGDVFFRLVVLGMSATPLVASGLLN